MRAIHTRRKRSVWRAGALSLLWGAVYLCALPPLGADETPAPASDTPEAASAEWTFEGTEEADGYLASEEEDIDAATDDRLPLAGIDRVHAYVIRLKGEVESALRHVIARGLREAEENSCHIVVIDMDTYGGQLFAAISIAEALSDSGLITATLVNKKAISAGALISLGTRFIGMAPGAIIGASTPMAADGGEMSEAVEEKINSVVRAEFRALAERNGHPPDIAEAMVDRRKVIPGLIDKDQLLTLTSSDAVDWGLAVGEAEDVPALLTLLGARSSVITTLVETPVEKIARFLSSSTVAALLMTVALICIYFELRTPGIGIAGAVGVLALLLFFFGNYLARLSGWAPLILALVGLVLLLIEIFALPGFGVAGIAGLLCLTGSFVLSLLDVPVTSRFFTADALVEPLMIVAISLAVFTVAAVVLTLLTPALAWRTPLTLHTVATPQDGYVAGASRPVVAPGQRGVALTALRPAGLAVFGDQEVNVVANGRFIDQGAPVQVVAVQAMRVVVEPWEEA